MLNYYKKHEKGVEKAVKKFAKIIKCKNQITELFMELNEKQLKLENLCRKAMEQRDSEKVNKLRKKCTELMNDTVALWIIENTYDQVHA